jgi:large subunit ribosomal protein L13
MKIYDASNQILGRIASSIAKDLMRGENINVINCEKVVISGSPKGKKMHYLERRWRGDPHHGPFFPRTPKGIVRRAIRGMLPFYKPKGREAFRRLKVYISIPEELKNKEYIRIENADVNKLRCKHIVVGDLSRALGSKKRW